MNLSIRDQGGSGRLLVWAHGLASSMALEDEAGLIDWSEALVLAVPPAARAARRMPAAMLRTASTTVRVAGKGAFLRMARLTVPPPILRGELEPFARSVVAGFEQMPRDRLAAILRAAADHDLPLDGALRGLDVPAIVFGWATDPGHPLATAQHLARVLPRAELHVAQRGADVRTWEPLVRSFMQAL